MGGAWLVKDGVSYHWSNVKPLVIKIRLSSGSKHCPKFRKFISSFVPQASNQ